MSANPTNTETPISRDDARAAIFAAKPTSYPAKFNGVDVVLLEPDLNDILSAQAQEDRKRGAAMMLVRFVHLPDGTPLFEEADIEQILTLPFNKDMRDLNTQIQKLIGVVPTNDDKSPAQAESD